MRDQKEIELEDLLCGVVEHEPSLVTFLLNKGETLAGFKTTISYPGIPEGGKKVGDGELGFSASAQKVFYKIEQVVRETNQNRAETRHILFAILDQQVSTCQTLCSILDTKSLSKMVKGSFDVELKPGDKISLPKELLYLLGLKKGQVVSFCVGPTGVTTVGGLVVIR